MTLYDLLLAMLRDAACLLKTSTIEIEPTTPHMEWAPLEIRDMWTKKVWGRILFHFESTLDKPPYLSAIDVLELLSPHEGIEDSKKYYVTKGARTQPGGWLRFKVTIESSEMISLDYPQASGYIFQIARRASEMASVDAHPIPVTIWANATVRDDVTITARTPGEACARALRGTRDWSIHGMLQEPLSQPQALAGKGCGDKPPAFLMKSCLNCTYMKVVTDFRGSEVTPPTTTQKCTKHMTLPLALVATYCPGWQEGKPTDETDQDDDKEG